MLARSVSRKLFSPWSATKAPKNKKSRIEQEQEEEEIEVEEEKSLEKEMSSKQQRGLGGSESLADTQTVHETVLTRVKEAMNTCFPSSGTELDVALARMVPVLATAVSVAVVEVMGVVMARMEERLEKLKPAVGASGLGLEAAVRRLTYENDRLQQYTRRESVRVFGIKQAEKETAEQVEEKVMSVMRDAGVEIEGDDIAACHRAGKSVNGARPILVKFVSRKKRRELMMKKKSLKGKEKYIGVFIGDDLTPLRSRLLGYVKRLPCVEKAWCIDGRIHCQKRVPPGLVPADHPRPIVVETPDDLFKLGLDHVDYTALGLGHLAFGEGAAAAGGGQ
jgi:hypothetical protein